MSEISMTNGNGKKGNYTGTASQHLKDVSSPQPRTGRIKPLLRLMINIPTRPVTQLT